MQYVEKYLIGIVWFCFKQCPFGHPHAPDGTPIAPTRATRNQPASLIVEENWDKMMFQSFGSEDSRRADVLPGSHSSLK